MRAAPPMNPIHTAGLVTLHHGDSLKLLSEMPTGSVQAVITDPPYSSGGLTRADRTNVGVSSKYVVEGTAKSYPEFFGDNRDQRSFVYWCTLWLAECWRLTTAGGYLFTFCDWRQLPAMTDAIQAGGWVWRGIVPWDKTEGSKPQRGWFRHQCEYILCATKGSMGQEQTREVSVCAPGLFRQKVNPAEKWHTTGKPVEVMQFLMQVLPKGSVILDPFAGAGSTLIAARNLGFQSIGIELSAEYCERIRARLAQDVIPLEAHNQPLPCPR